MSDDVYDLASRTITALQEEVRQWRIMAEDSAKDLEALREVAEELGMQLKHYKRIAEIHQQILDEKDGAIRAYKELVEYQQSSGLVGRQSEEIIRLQRKLRFAMAHVPRGDGETFVFEDGDEADYGPHIFQELEAEDNYDGKAG